MYKLIKVLMVIGLVTAILVTSHGKALAFPGGTWVSGVQVANLSNSTATVSISFYNTAGTMVLNFDGGTIAANSSKTWYLPDHVPGLSAGFIGSAVVSSDQEIAAIVNTQLPSGSAPHRIGTSTGVSSPAATVYATQVMKDYWGWNSYCAVQNTGSTSVDVTATFYNASGVAVDTDTQSIPAYSSYLFDQSTDSDLSTSFSGSAKFQSDASHPLAVVCNFYSAGTSASTMQFQSYNGMSSGATTLYVPRIVKDYYSYQSGLRVQNIGTEALTVNVVYNFGGTAYTQTSPSIGPGQAWGPYMGDKAQLPASMANVSGSGSAIITVNSPNANKLIIATVNEDNRVNPAGRGVTYEAALLSEAQATIVFPQITSEYYGYCGGFQVMKVSPGTANCTANYSVSGGISAFSVSFTLTDQNPAWSQFAPNANGMRPGNANDNYNGSVTVSCPGASIVGISNFSHRSDVDGRYGTVTGDTYITARGIGK